MRPILPSDLDHCVRAMLAVEASVRRVRMREIINRADVADRFRKARGRFHPEFGDGSLMGAAQGTSRSDLPPSCNSAYCTALSLVLAEIEDWRRRGGI